MSILIWEKGLQLAQSFRINKQAEPTIRHLPLILKIVLDCTCDVTYSHDGEPSERNQILRWTCLKDPNISGSRYVVEYFD